MSPFQQFIEAEMKNRKLESLRRFAEFVGVSHQTMNRLMKPTDPEMPSRRTLVKIAEATNIDIRYIVGLVEPEGLRGIATEAGALADKIGRLPKRDQDAIRAMVDAMLHEGVHNNAKN
jgi:transcriptional regulator with XRE-family HTH domain